MSNRLALNVLLVAICTSATAARVRAQDVPPAPVAPPSTQPTAPTEQPAPTAPPTPPGTQPVTEARVAPPPPSDHDHHFHDHDHDHHHHHDHGDYWNHCHDCMPRPPRGDFMPAFFAGAGMFELTGMNKRLAAAGYDRLDNLQAVIGGEVRIVHPNGLLTGAYAAAILPNTGDGPNRLRASWNGGFGLLDVGYAFVHTPNFTLSLSGGPGLYWASLTISQRGDASFNDVLASPRRSTSVGVGGLLLGAVLRADGRIPLGAPRGDRQSYLALGLRVSGLWGPAIGGWDFDENNDDVNSGPSGNLAGVYAALVIGWGGTSINPTP